MAKSEENVVTAVITDICTLQVQYTLKAILQVNLGDP